MCAHRIFVPVRSAVYDLDWLLATPGGQGLLGKSHPAQRRHRLRCTCQLDPARQPGLVVRLLGDHYYVARMPDTGHLHERRCAMFSEDPAHSGVVEYEGALRYSGEMAQVKVSFPLHASLSQSRAPAVTLLAHGGMRRGSMGMGGVLALLWTHAGLNSWTPGMVLPWVRVHTRLVGAAHAIYLGKRRLVDHLFVQGEPRANWLPTVPVQEEDWGHYKLVLFKIATAVATPHGGAWFKSTSGDAFLVTQSVLGALARSYPRVLHTLEHPPVAGSRDRPNVICLGLVHWKVVRGAPCLCLLQGALMMTNWRSIPVESAYELLIADQLVEQERRFTKPMRFDAAEEEVFPDFLLSDAGLDSVPMEVYGVSGNPVYEARKQVKRALYQASGTRFWEWSPPEAVPPFPARVGE